MSQEAFANEPIEQLVPNTIRTLTIDAVEKAKSGHPGLPMGCADIAYVLWTKFLKFNPANPQWSNRDRFVLSAGHGSMLIYSLLHLTGFEQVTLDQLKNFRQWASCTPGHPESHDTEGVEVTTGPLGQGTGNSVGLAIAEKFAGWRYNTDAHQIVDHHTYAIVSDGDLQEGISHEAASLAGHLGIGKLIWFYDDNQITIEGKTELSFSENIPQRFESYNWHVQTIDGHDHAAIENAIKSAQSETGKPSIIVCKTTIGFGSPARQGTQKAHSDAFGPEEVAATKKNLGWPEDEHFLVPEKVTAFFNELKPKWAALEAEWQKTYDAYKAANADKAAQFEAAARGELPADIESKLPVFEAGKDVATRSAGGNVLESLFAALPNLLGGSADLAPSTKTWIKDYPSFLPDSIGPNLHFGVREHAMGTVVAGIGYYGGLIAFGSTFFVFTDYMRPPIRLSALSHLQGIYVFTHDSIFVGEDGPTHEPVEHLATLRAIPRMSVFRPADANETSYSWLAALKNTDRPTALVLTRQNLPTFDRGEGKCAPATDVLKGAYTLWESSASPEIILIGTGSEVSLCYDAAQILAESGKAVRVVSMPSWDAFEAQSQDYKDSVLPPSVTKRVCVEAGVSFGWDRYAGPAGKIIAIDRFGASAPYQTLATEFGLTVDHVLAAANSL